jgi:3-deoxy-7-phosphoheptulonate synthase
MIIILRPHASPAEIDQVLREVEILGYTPSPIHGANQTVIAAIGDETTHASLESLNVLPQVERVLRVQKRYKMVSRESKPQGTVVSVGAVGRSVAVGGPGFTLMAGPCSPRHGKKPA